MHTPLSSLTPEDFYPVTGDIIQSPEKELCFAVAEATNEAVTGKLEERLEEDSLGLASQISDKNTQTITDISYEMPDPNRDICPILSPQGKQALHRLDIQKPRFKVRIRIIHHHEQGTVTAEYTIKEETQGKEDDILRRFETGHGRASYTENIEHTQYLTIPASVYRDIQTCPENIGEYLPVLRKTNPGIDWKIFEKSLKITSVKSRDRTNYIFANGAVVSLEDGKKGDKKIDIEAASHDEAVRLAHELGLLGYPHTREQFEKISQLTQGVKQKVYDLLSRTPETAKSHIARLIHDLAEHSPSLYGKYLDSQSDPLDDTKDMSETFEKKWARLFPIYAHQAVDQILTELGGVEKSEYGITRLIQSTFLKLSMIFQIYGEKVSHSQMTRLLQGDQKTLRARLREIRKTNAILKDDPILLDLIVHARREESIGESEASNEKLIISTHLTQMVRELHDRVLPILADEPTMDHLLPFLDRIHRIRDHITRLSDLEILDGGFLEDILTQYPIIESGDRDEQLRSFFGEMLRLPEDEFAFTSFYDKYTKIHPYKNPPKENFLKLQPSQEIHRFLGSLHQIQLQQNTSYLPALGVELIQIEKDSEGVEIAKSRVSREQSYTELRDPDNTSRYSLLNQMTHEVRWGYFFKEMIESSDDGLTLAHEYPIPFGDHATHAHQDLFAEYLDEVRNQRYSEWREYGGYIDITKSQFENLIDPETRKIKLPDRATRQALVSTHPNMVQLLIGWWRFVLLDQEAQRDHPDEENPNTRKQRRNALRASGRSYGAMERLAQEIYRDESSFDEEERELDPEKKAEKVALRAKLREKVVFGRRPKNTSGYQYEDILGEWDHAYQKHHISLADSRFRIGDRRFSQIPEIYTHGENPQIHRQYLKNMIDTLTRLLQGDTPRDHEEQMQTLVETGFLTMSGDHPPLYALRDGVTPDTIGHLKTFVKYVYDRMKGVEKMLENSREDLDFIHTHFGRSEAINQKFTVATSIKRENFSVGPPKTLDRVTTKVFNKYEGDAMELGDLVRMRITQNTAEDLRRSMQGFMEYAGSLDEAKKLYIEDNVGNLAEKAKKGSGYRDMTITLELTGGNLVEVQFLLAPMEEAKTQGYPLIDEQQNETPLLTEMSQERFHFDAIQAAEIQRILSRLDHDPEIDEADESRTSGETTESRKAPVIHRLPGVYKRFFDLSIVGQYSDLFDDEKTQMSGDELYDICREIPRECDQSLHSLRQQLQKMESMLYDQATGVLQASELESMGIR